jgi:hypothetical protein
MKFVGEHCYFIYVYLIHQFDSFTVREEEEDEEEEDEESAGKSVSLVCIGRGQSVPCLCLSYLLCSRCQLLNVNIAV